MKTEESQRKYEEKTRCYNGEKPDKKLTEKIHAQLQ